jgi:hypothetical protein
MTERFEDPYDLDPYDLDPYDLDAEASLELTADPVPATAHLGRGYGDPVLPFRRLGLLERLRSRFGRTLG